MPFKFSKEKFCWSLAETQRKQLEEELKLSCTDSQSSRQATLSTSHWEQKTLHFLIRKSVVSPVRCTPVRHSLEGEAFDSSPLFTST
ncbi:SH2 domain-containing protein 3C-like isoform X1 [Lates japonicus]|uniref:SH2 domain-containing protein 3C-like isoform X1 n=1 Tax=Lates japonicus TaxID=270547 RepID=A0AAD3RNT8_LATJO|nr:SH2 domain-containing protein 3C-like isoform X1 [Lates japonicus]